MIVVRPAEPDDAAAAEAIDALCLATLRETYRPTPAAEQNRARRQDGLSRLVAAIEQRIVGTVQWYAAGASLHLLGLGVHPEFRRRGIARELLACLEPIARNHGATRLRLYTVKETGNVERFTRLGFVVTDECEASCFESDQHPTLTEVAMERRVP